MATIGFLTDAFIKELERDVIASVGVSLSRNKKIVTARTVKSVHAVTTFKGSKVDIDAFGGEGLPYITTDKPANTKLPVDFVGNKTGRGGRTVKIFELKPHLKDWKAVVGFRGPDFLLARAIARNPRKAVDISTEATKYLSKTVSKKILTRFRKSIASEIVNPFADV